MSRGLVGSCCVGHPLKVELSGAQLHVFLAFLVSFVQLSSFDVEGPASRWQSAIDPLKAALA